MKIRCLKAAGILCAFVLMLTGCSLVEESVETMEDWSFQYNEEGKDYSLFFTFCNKEGEPISSNATVDIKIVNSEKEIVYRDTKLITESDFGYYSRISDETEKLFADVKIPEDEITKGKAAKGKVYFTVYKDGEFSFDEATCNAENLPVKDINLKIVSLPITVDVKSYTGGIQSKISITSVKHKVDMGAMSVAVSGKKTYGINNGIFDIIKYKIYDTKGYVVETGRIMLDSLNTGEKFRDDSIIVYDLTPGETYTIKFYSE